MWPLVGIQGKTLVAQGMAHVQAQPVGTPIRALQVVKKMAVPFVVQELPPSLGEQLPSIDQQRQIWGQDLV
jgi:hypothetical protein